ncbi:MAG: hypothetical protein KatS3mg103_0833 [Phycisphaerales bacterium]|nr:MAG: hypothetical protein KatS3mg103_0833 [Phycisphaerales bacterium]
MTNHLLAMPQAVQPQPEPAAPNGSHAGGGVWISPEDQHWFNEGTHARLYRKLGAHPLPGGGVHFGVWAPNAQAVWVVGDWNGWSVGADALMPVGCSGLWAGVCDRAREGCRYKYVIDSHAGGRRLEKTDPMGFWFEQPPRTAAIVHGLEYRWQDQAWMQGRGQRHRVDRPMSIYELHVGSWRRVPEDGNRSLNYRELAPRLAEYCQRLGFTHVELLPVSRAPFYGAGATRSPATYAPSSRYGTPQDLQYLIDTPAPGGHRGDRSTGCPPTSPATTWALARFDGTALYEHADPREGAHPDWGTLIFNYGRHEVRNFLLPAPCSGCDGTTLDGLRVDAVASMLYRDYSRREGEWVPNELRRPREPRGHRLPARAQPTWCTPSTRAW